MSDIVLRDDLIEKLRDIARRENRPIDDVVETLLDQYEDEAAWDESVMEAALGDALNPDGSINFDKLRAKTQPVTLEELYPEGSEDDEA